MDSGSVQFYSNNILVTEAVDNILVSIENARGMKMPADLIVVSSLFLLGM